MVGRCSGSRLDDSGPIGSQDIAILLGRIHLERLNGRLTFRRGLAKKTIYVSDITGKEIRDNDAATVTIRPHDARRPQVVLDVNLSEVKDLADKGTKQARRGRKPKQQD